MKKDIHVVGAVINILHLKEAIKSFYHYDKNFQVAKLEKK
jgi:hypothetical protein